MATTTETRTEAERVTIPVSGMTCAACSGRVQRTLEKQPGVAAAAVNLMTRNATVEFDPAATTPGRAGGGDPRHRLRGRAGPAGPDRLRRSRRRRTTPRRRSSGSCGCGRA